MAKNEKNDNATPLALLDNDEQKRLEKLGEEWNGGCSWPDKLTAHDFRLLLENFSPVHELIRQIATTASGQAAPNSISQTAQESIWAQAKTERDEAEAECKILQTQIASIRSETEYIRQQLDEERRQTSELGRELKRVQQLLSVREQELEKMRQQAALPPVLELLRRMPELANRLELDNLPADAKQGLIRAVAVLSQLNSVERLWNALKESCERERRPASENELALLQTALDWHNHNWKKKPYTLHYPRTETGFDFKTEQRVATTPSGETLKAIWLPGIVSGSDCVQKKALVVTG